MSTTRKTKNFLSASQKQALLLDAGKRNATVVVLAHRYNVAVGTMRNHLRRLGVGVHAGRIVSVPKPLQEALPLPDAANGCEALSDRLIELAQALRVIEDLAAPFGMKVTVERIKPV